MQQIDLDQTDRRILRLLQAEPGIKATEVGERIGLSQSACWRRIQRLRDEGVIKDQPAILDREKVGLSTMVFAQVKLTSHGRTNITDFADAVRRYPEVLDKAAVCVIAFKAEPLARDRRNDFNVFHTLPGYGPVMQDAPLAVQVPVPGP